MQSRLFWKEWPKPQQAVYLLLLLMAAGSLVWFGYNYFIGTEGIIGWDTMAKTERVSTLIDSFKLGPFTLNTTDDNILFFQNFTGSEALYSPSSYYLLFAITIIGMVIFITVVSDLPSFWFFVGLTVFLGLLVNFKFEVLLLFGSSQKWGLIGTILIYFSAAYFFNKINDSFSFLTRLATFTVITLVLGAIIYYTAEVNTPFLYMSVYGIINPLLVSLVFIIMVSHEIIASFVYLLTRSNSASSKNSLTHFYLISSIYLINVLLLYLHDRGIIDWNIVYINTYLLLAVSAIIGIWGFQRRAAQFANILGASVNGALIFIIMFVVCFATIAHFTATFNDPALYLIEDVIIYAHLGFDVIFLVYITSNFIEPLGKNMQVYKVLYKPSNMPYFTYCFAGLIACAALVFTAGWSIYVHKGYSAYYNSIADMHYINGELPLADTYYKQGAFYGYQNHKSHYMLANLCEKRGDDINAAINYKKAIAKNPSPQAYANLSNLYLTQDNFFDALFTLNEGNAKLPGNPRLENNLGIVYAKTNIVDTASFYIEKATNYDITAKTAQSNLVALLAKNKLDIDLDSIFSDWDSKGDLIAMNNELALYNQNRDHFSSDYWPKDSILSFLEASVLYNQSFNQLFATDSLSSKPILSLVSRPENAEAYEMLSFGLSINWYKQNNITQAFRKLNWLANNSPIQGGKFFNTLGLWALEQGASETAIDHFSWASERFFKDAPFNKAIALTEASHIPQAMEEWVKLSSTGPEGTREIARTMLEILNPQQRFSDLPDNKKYLFLKYQLSYKDTTLFKGLIDNITDANYKGQAILDMSNKLWKKDLNEAAIGIYASVAGLQITDKTLFDKIQWFELNMLAAQGNVRGLATKINQGIEFDKEHAIEKHYFSGLVSEASGDTTKAAENYKLIAYMNPFKEEATIAAANFLNVSDKFEAYNILINAIEINPRSVKLLKAYILQCARVQLDNYAQLSMEDLKPLISDKAFQNFVNDYNQLVKQVAEEEANF